METPPHLNLIKTSCTAVAQSDISERSAAMRDVVHTRADIKTSAVAISQITSVINNIALQTNILALMQQ